MRARSMVLLLAAAWLGGFGCKGGSAPPPAAGGTGQARLALEAPSLPRIVSVDYNLKFYWLDVDPALLYNEVTMSTARPGGELVAVLPCRTSGDTGLNQVQVEATIHFQDQPDPVVATASAVFTCHRNADTPLNIVVSIGGQLDAGFVDVDVAPTAVLCASKVDFRGDEFLAVCAQSSCGNPQAVFLFANTCQTLSGNPPRFWVCGDPADWTIAGSLANAQFPMPTVDGSWRWEILAADPIRLSQVDLTLTDDQGNLRVWPGLANPSALLERQGGAVTRSEIDRERKADFVAALIAPAQTAGGPAPERLLLIRNAPEGARAYRWTNFGACEVSVAGTSFFAGQKVIDVRLESASEAKLILSNNPDGLATGSAKCRAEWAGVRPSITCDAAGPLQ